jgi:cytochrome c oxidase subunit 4
MVEGHRQPNYIGVFWWLLALTIVEVGVIFLPLAKLAITILLVGLALSKASLVAMYFMHLKFERRTLGLIAVTPLLLCVLLVFALLPDLSGSPPQTVGAPAPPAVPRSH